MRTFWIITLVLVTVLVMATAASASVRDSVASLVGDRTGAAEDSGDGGTFTVKAVRPAKASPARMPGRSRPRRKPRPRTPARRRPFPFGPVVEPSGDGDCDADRTGDEIAPVGPEAEVQPEEPVADETATKKAKGKAEETAAE